MTKSNSLPSVSQHFASRAPAVRAICDSARIVKRQQVSARRWYLEVRLEDPSQVDGELKGWLEKSIELSV